MIETWRSYSLDDFLMFSPASYFRRYELANADFWPGQLLLVAMAVALLWMVARRRTYSTRRVGLLLAAAWILVAGVFLFRHFAQINPIANAFALMFVLQALLLSAFGCIRSYRQYVFRPGLPAAGYPGMFLLLYALLIHPLVGLFAGRSWQGVELFGLAPDATALATIGILLTGLRAAGWPLLIIPFAWCGTSALTYLAMNYPYGVLPLFVAVAALVATILLRLRLDPTARS